MTREELLTLVNGKVDTTKFKSLSPRTINEELDDVLDEIGDDQEANDSVVTKLANRLKRMDGNLHANVADEVKKAREEAERRRKEEEERRQAEQNKPKPEPTPGDFDELKELRARIEKMEQDAKEREAKQAKEAMLASVREGLRSKFSSAKLEMNDFFANIALSKLNVPSEGADLSALVSEAESIYNSDIKAAGFTPESKPRGGSGSGGTDKIDEHEWDDIAERYK